MRIKLIARIMAEGVRDIFSLLHATIRKHGQQLQTVRLGNAWVNIDARGWKTRDDMTINVALGSGGKAQQFAQTMAVANIQKQLIAGGKTYMVSDRELYNTAAELTRIMGHKNPDAFFNDPTAVNPQTGQLLNPPAAPPQPPPDPKLLAVQARAQVDAALAAHQAQLQQQKAQNDAIHLQVKTQGDIELARIKAALDTKMTLLETHLKAAIEAGKVQRSYPRRWNDPVTNEPRLRLDRGHVTKEGQPFDLPNAAVDHVHGYDVNGDSIMIDGDHHIPITGE